MSDCRDHLNQISVELRNPRIDVLLLFSEKNVSQAVQQALVP
jgi:hypothetical protein